MQTRVARSDLLRSSILLRLQNALLLKRFRKVKFSLAVVERPPSIFNLRCTSTFLIFFLHDPAVHLFSSMAFPGITFILHRLIPLTSPLYHDQGESAVTVTTLPSHDFDDPGRQHTSHIPRGLLLTFLPSSFRSPTSSDLLSYYRPSSAVTPPRHLTAQPHPQP